MADSTKSNGHDIKTLKNMACICFFFLSRKLFVYYYHSIKILLRLFTKLTNFFSAITETLVVFSHPMSKNCLFHSQRISPDIVSVDNPVH